jgi:hypothetical protein
MRVLNHVLLKPVCRQRPGLQFLIKGQSQNSLIPEEIMLPGVVAKGHKLRVAGLGKREP